MGYWSWREIQHQALRGKRLYLEKYLMNSFGKHLTTNTHRHLLGVFILLHIEAKMGSSKGLRDVMTASGSKFNPI